MDSRLYEQLNRLHELALMISMLDRRNPRYLQRAGKLGEMIRELLAEIALLKQTLLQKA